VYAFFGGAYIGLQSSVVAEVVEVDDFTHALGLLYALSAAGYVLGPVLFAVLVDATGHTSYLGGQIFVGSITLLGALPIFALLYKAYMEKKYEATIGHPIKRKYGA